MDHFGFIKSVYGLGERIIIAVADTADGGDKPGLGELFSCKSMDLIETYCLHSNGRRNTTGVHLANDLGFTEITIAALIGHAKESVTSKYVHTLDSTLIMAADTVSGYIKALLKGVEFRRSTYTLDRQSRQNTIDQVLVDAAR